MIPRENPKCKLCGEYVETLYKPASVGDNFVRWNFEGHKCKREIENKESNKSNEYDFETLMSYKKKQILYRWKSDGRAYSKSYIQDVVKTESDKIILELSNTSVYTEYPTRINLADIEIEIPIKKLTKT